MTGIEGAYQAVISLSSYEAVAFIHTKFPIIFISSIKFQSYFLNSSFIRNFFPIISVDFKKEVSFKSLKSKDSPVVFTLTTLIFLVVCWLLRFRLFYSVFFVFFSC